MFAIDVTVCRKRGARMRVRAGHHGLPAGRPYRGPGYAPGGDNDLHFFGHLSHEARNAQLQAMQAIAQIHHFKGAAVE